MFIDKYKQEDGYYDRKGNYYEDAESFIIVGILGFCGCGMPDEVLKYVRDALQSVDDLIQLVWTEKITDKEWESRNKRLFTSYGAEYFMWYFLDAKGLTEHGGSVPGWLTLKGQELLSDLTDMINK